MYFLVDDPKYIDATMAHFQVAVSGGKWISDYATVANATCDFQCLKLCRAQVVCMCVRSVLRFF
jgi:hypothetical protein